MTESKMISIEYREEANVNHSLMGNIVASKYSEFLHSIFKQVATDNYNVDDVCNFIIRGNLIFYYGKQVGNIKTEISEPNEITDNFSCRWTFIPS